MVELRLAEVTFGEPVFPAPRGGWPRRSNCGRNTWGPRRCRRRLAPPRRRPLAVELPQPPPRVRHLGAARRRHSYRGPCPGSWATPPPGLARTSTSTSETPFSTASSAQPVTATTVSRDGRTSPPAATNARRRTPHRAPPAAPDGEQTRSARGDTTPSPPSVSPPPAISTDQRRRSQPCPTPNSTAPISPRYTTVHRRRRRNHAAHGVSALGSRSFSR